MSKERTIKINNKNISLPQTKGEVLFWKFINQGLDKKEAYIKAYPNSNPKYALIYASKIYNKKKFEPIKENLWDQFKEDAKDAYRIQKEIMQKQSTEDELRVSISNKILDRAGYSPIAKTAQLRFNSDAHNPLLEKSTEELKQLAEKTNKEMSEIKREMLRLNSGKGQEDIIEGEIEDGD